MKNVYHQSTSSNNEEMPDAPLMIGIRVHRVEEAIHFYQGIGFKEHMCIPDEDGNLLMCILSYGSSVIEVGILEGLPNPDTERERNIKKGPRGLGVKIGLAVPDLDSIYEFFKERDCVITTEPMEEFWGDRLFTAIDPFDFEWQITQTVKEMTPDEQKEAGKKAWF